MKKAQIILILIFLGYYLAQTTDDICATEFSERKNKKCEDIHSSCVLTDYLGCISKKDITCSEGDNDRDLCIKLYPNDYPKHKCVWDGDTKCNRENTECNDFNLKFTILMKGNRELCSQFTETTPGKKCILEADGQTCKSHYSSCLDSNILNDQTKCESNIPEDYKMKCVWDTHTSKCTQTPRKCDDTSFYVNEEECHNLKTADDNKQKCVYDNGVCYQKYIKCDYIQSPGSLTCGVHPLELKEGTYYDYDYKNKCVYKSGSGRAEDPDKCVPVPIYCEDYLGSDESICIQHIAKDRNKRCVYGQVVDNSGTPSVKCYEEYKTCESYTDNSIDTDKSGCTSIKLLEKNEKCVYIEEEDNCVTKSLLTYQNCEDYTGNSKRVCESIVLSPSNRSYCILDKDMKCKERPLFCEEAFGEDECLHIAKANDTNRRCAYNYSDGKCFEEYIRCEDWTPNSNSGSSISSGSISCSNIRLFNGKKCKYEYINNIERCYSDFKICTDAKTEEECKLITKTGVTDPERKVCAWFGTCIETFKYCSDYRKICGSSDASCKNFCENIIKPYDEYGENIDIRFKCVYEDDIGCQRAPVDCEDTRNPILCDLYSNYIKDKEERHCVYYNGRCSKHSRKCKDVEGDHNDCKNNIIDNYIINACDYDYDNDKCVENDDCMKKAGTTTTNYYEEMLCKKINPNCTYSSGECKYTEENTCEDIYFYSNETENKETCEKMVATDPRKKCTLKKDLSGCEEVYRELDFSTASNSYSTPPDASNQGNSSGFIKKGIHLIIALFCLII